MTRPQRLVATTYLKTIQENLGSEAAATVIGLIPDWLRPEQESHSAREEAR